MKALFFAIVLLSGISHGASAVKKLAKSEKIEKYMGSCDIEDSKLKAHLTYISETGYDDGYSNRGIIVEFTDEKGRLVGLDKNINSMPLTGFTNEVKVSNSWRKFELKKNGNYFGGSEGKIKIYKVRNEGSIDYEYQCFDGTDCGKYEAEIDLKNCKLDYLLNGKKIH